jgi:tetratricopeptide (TPR) repeat protein
MRELSVASLGTPTVVFLQGASGAGKSTLVAQFVERAQRERRAIAFEWRVYEQEAIPFRALDGLLDKLSQHLRAAPAGSSSSVAPLPTRRALGQLFPVLRSLSGFNPTDPGRRPDPLLTRRIAAEGLLGILERVASDGPLVLVMDDAQWGDLDSAGLLGDALARVANLPVLLVLVHRELGAEGSRFLATLRRDLAHLTAKELTLGTLSAVDVRELLVGTLGSEAVVSNELVDAVLHHSTGNAFLAQELAHTVGPGASLAVPTLAGAGVASLDSLLLAQRLEGLDGAARRLLEVVSTSGRAIRTETAAVAAGVDSRLDALVSSLSQRRLLRTAHDGEVELLEVRHDRIRGWILARLSADERRAHHRRLAQALEATAGAEPDLWLEHWLGADDPTQIRRAGLAAAQRATARLALKRAEALYRTVLAQGQPDAQQAGEVYRALAEVLEWDGRGADAAVAYLEASELTSGVERSRLQSNAGMRLIYAGRFSEGAERLRTSLQELGLAAPSSGVHALTRLVVERLRIGRLESRLGLHVRTEASTEETARIDVLHAAAFGFIFTDPLLGECMQAGHVVAAQKYGSKTQLARALALEASHRAHRPRRRGQTDAAVLFGRAENIATDANDEDLLEFIQACRGVAEFLCGRWSRAHELLGQAYRDVPRHRAGWHTTAWTYDVLALCNLGRFEEVGRRSAELVEAADARGDRFASSMLRVSARAPFLLARNDSEAARAELVEGMKVWDQPRFLVQHWRAMWWSAEADLYDGLGGAARARCLRDERRLDKSFLLRVRYIRGMTCFLRARAALATFSEAPRARAAEALAWHRKLSADKSPWTDALAAIVLAGEALAAQMLPANRNGSCPVRAARSTARRNCAAASPARVAGRCAALLHARFLTSRRLPARA